jgi:hypothetical protein
LGCGRHAARACSCVAVVQTEPHSGTRLPWTDLHPSEGPMALRGSTFVDFAVSRSVWWESSSPKSEVQDSGPDCHDRQQLAKD